MEGLPAVISANGITLIVADMIISGDENADSLCLYEDLISGMVHEKFRVSYHSLQAF